MSTCQSPKGKFKSLEGRGGANRCRVRFPLRVVESQPGDLRCLERTFRPFPCLCTGFTCTAIPALGGSAHPLTLHLSLLPLVPEVQSAASQTHLPPSLQRAMAPTTGSRAWDGPGGRRLPAAERSLTFGSRAVGSESLPGTTIAQLLVALLVHTSWPPLPSPAPAPITL